MSPRAAPKTLRSGAVTLQSELSSGCVSISQVDQVESDATSDMVSVLGFGSLLSERSSRLTFPDLQNFRLARVRNYRRVFGHPTSIFFRRGIACLETKQMSSLSVEYCEGHAGFIATVFEVPSDGMLEDGVPSLAFLEREEEFDIFHVPYLEFHEPSQQQQDAESKTALICARSTDDAYLERWGKERFHEYYAKYGIESIWGWKENSGLRPCAVYLRHCYLSAQSMGEECLASFLDDTVLVDRITTVRQYLEQYPEVLLNEPPPELVDRYSG